MASMTSWVGVVGCLLALGVLLAALATRLVAILAGLTLGGLQGVGTHLLNGSHNDAACQHEQEDDGTKDKQNDS